MLFAKVRQQHRTVKCPTDEGYEHQRQRQPKTQLYICMSTCLRKRLLLFRMLFPAVKSVQHIQLGIRARDLHDLHQLITNLIVSDEEFHPDYVLRNATGTYICQKGASKQPTVSMSQSKCRCLFRTSTLEPWLS